MTPVAMPELVQKFEAVYYAILPFTVVISGIGLTVWYWRDAKLWNSKYYYALSIFWAIFSLLFLALSIYCLLFYLGYVNIGGKSYDSIRLRH